MDDQHRADTCPYQHQIGDTHRMMADVHRIVTGNGDPDRGLFARVVRIEAERSMSRWGIPILVSAVISGGALLVALMK